jgi:hypothetical protein
MRILLLLLVLLPQGLWAIRQYSLGQTLNVLAAKGLNLRDKPHGDKVLRALPYGSQVVVAEKPNQDYPFESDGIKGYWVKVRVGESTFGYVFDGFLSALPAPDPACGSLAAYCAQTFRPVSPKIVKEIYYWQNEGLMSSFVQPFEYQGRIFALSENRSPFGNTVELVLPGASLEEAWLIARVCLRAELEAAKKAVAEGMLLDLEDRQVLPRHYDEFGTLNFQGNGCVAWPMGITDQYLSLNEAEGSATITVPVGF